jgi:hypothetical protein
MPPSKIRPKQEAGRPTPPGLLQPKPAPDKPAGPSPADTVISAAGEERTVTERARAMPALQRSMGTARVNRMLGEASEAPALQAKPRSYRGKSQIDYDRLIADRRLQIGVAIGAEVAGEYPALLSWLAAEGFVQQSAGAPGAPELWSKTITFTLKRRGKPRRVAVLVEISVVHEGTPDATAEFGRFLTDKEITIYSGHARYGTGPDFDAEKSPAENFVIGVNSALHRAGRLKNGYSKEMRDQLRGRANDLEALSKAGKFSARTYQLWFFNACTSLHYLDEIRGGLVTVKKRGKHTKKSRVDLRFVGTRRSVSADALPFLIGLLNQESLAQLLARMDKEEARFAPPPDKPTKQAPPYLAD